MKDDEKNLGELAQSSPVFISSKLKIFIALLSIIIAVSYLAISSF